MSLFRSFDVAIVNVDEMPWWCVDRGRGIHFLASAPVSAYTLNQPRLT
jgi:hypothetical protein